VLQHLVSADDIERVVGKVIRAWAAANVEDG
jgi:hypothetical protein